MFETIHSKEELLNLVNRVGILPFFKNSIPGWSLEECIEPSLWFGDLEGPWEWKGQMAKEKTCVYSKLIKNGNAWVSLEWFPDLCNYRRNGYDFEGLCEDGLVRYRDKLLMQYLSTHTPILSKIAKRSWGLSIGYDAALTSLEMQTFVINQDFVYSIDKTGKPYGWGNALLTLPETYLGEEYVNQADRYSPQESFERLCQHLMSVLPGCDEAQLRKMLK